MRLIRAWVELETPPPASRARRLARPLRQSDGPIHLGGQRIVDLGPGDEIRHNDKRYKVAGVKPFLEHANVSAESLRERSIQDGFVAA